MAIRSFPYVSVDGDRKITATNEAERIDQIVDSGIIFDDPTSFECQIETGTMNINVSPGSAIIKGHGVISNEIETVTISDSESAYSRIDLIVLESNTNTEYRKAYVKVIKGVGDATPQEPELSTEAGISQLKLAKVLVPSSVLYLDTATITDLRAGCFGKHNHKFSQITDVVDADYKNPTGTINVFAGNAAPQGWLLCQGQEVSRTTYARLFGVLGSTYGEGDGSTTFNLPDLKGRVPIGFDNSQNEFDSLGETGGEKKHANNADENGPHTHLLNIGGTNIDKATPYMTGGSGTFWNMAVGYEGINSFGVNSSGNGTPHNNLQPYITLNYIIKY